MNIPNSLTVIRLLLVPVFILVFFSTITHNFIMASIIFVLAGATDVLDGYIARRYHLITKWGQVMDPLADKLMQLTVLACLTIDNRIPIWIIIIYGVKELSMIFGGIFLYTKKEKIVIPANFFGKIATILFYIAVLSIIIGKTFSTYLFIIAVSFSVFAFIQYSVIGSKKLKKIQ